MNKYLVTSSQTHFIYNEEKSTVKCTHGEWSGKIKFNDDGSCVIDVGFTKLNYDSYEFTEFGGIYEYMSNSHE
tara:strand:+ start:3412 stop:3630 length:219 start_codon:yes stop_codon:yes gene_type:complete